jgi:hypothetical protein
VGLTVLLGVVLALPSVFDGLINDDHLQLAMVRSGSRAPWDLFHFWSKDAARLSQQIHAGDVPWIVAPEAKLAFVRPLVSVSHWLEYRFFPDATFVMHVHNVVWYALLVLTVAHLYLALSGRKFSTVLALFLFAFSPSLGVASAWLACRNTMVATALGMFALTAHHKHRSSGAKGSTSVWFFALSLLSGEMSAGTLAYFLSYAAFLDRATWRSRAFSIAPHVAMAGVFWGAEIALGYGVSATSFYAPPGQGSVFFLRAFFERYLPMLTLENGWGYVQLLGASELPPPFLLLLILATWVVAFVPSVLGDRKLAFWVGGTLAAIVPVSFALPQTRVLVAAHVGGAAAVARLFELTVLSRRPRLRTRLVRAPAAFVAWVAVCTGLVLGPLSMSAASIITRRFADTERMWARTLDASSHQDAFVAGVYWLTAPIALETRRELGLDAPRSVTTLTNGDISEFERLDGRTLRVRAPGGLLGPLGRGLRSVPFRKGERIEAPRCTVEIIDAGVSDPVIALFRFDRDLDDASYSWFVASPSGFVRVLPPAVGAHIPVVNMGGLPQIVR